MTVGTITIGVFFGLALFAVAKLIVLVLIEGLA